MGQIQDYSYYNVILWKKGGNQKRFPKHISRFVNTGENDDYIMFLKLEGQYPIPNIDGLIGILEPILTVNDKTFIILTPRKDPHLYTATADEYVFSFCCKFKHYKRLFTFINQRDISSKDLLFELLDQMGESHSPFNKILVKQFPFEDKIPINNQPCDVIIPYRGQTSYLNTVLHFLKFISSASTFVGIDQDMTKDVEDLMKCNPPFFRTGLGDENSNLYNIFHPSACSQLLRR